MTNQNQPCVVSRADARRVGKEVVKSPEHIRDCSWSPHRLRAEISPVLKNRLLKGYKQRKQVFSGPSFADAADRAPPQHPLNAYVIAFHIKVSVWASSRLVHLEEVSILSWVAQVIICVYFLPFSYET